MSIQQLCTAGHSGCLLVEGAHAPIGFPAQCPPAPRSRHFPFIQRNMPIDQYESDPISPQFGFFKGRAILDFARVEEDQIGR